MTEISIGQQSEGGDRLGWPKVHLYHMFEKHCTASYCPTNRSFCFGPPLFQFGGRIRAGGH